VKRFQIHLVSDATGETLEAVVKACLAQFENVEVVKHFWPMVRSERQLDRVLVEIEGKPGLVLYTMVNPQLRDRLEEGCDKFGIPTIAVLNPVLKSLSQFFGEPAKGLPGRQYALDAAYFRRIEAMQFTMAHDDGQMTHDLEGADIVLLGVSRTSKTPTSIYLANRGYKTANIPLVPDVAVPEHVFSLSKPLVVGLTTHPDRLVQVRRNRIMMLNQRDETDYVDPEKVEAEVQAARKLFVRHDIPILDVSRRSIEETAAAIINLALQRQQAAQPGPPPGASSHG
jgi:[pyruvate, water dikinase]-phosphate phosphotransferase / [pyruvate, water dikinase] kinase